jgi:hypothetical protein
VSKPKLEWEQRGPTIHAAKIGTAQYYAVVRESEFYYNVRLSYAGRPYWGSADFESLEAAKAACERHWESQQ